MPSPESAPTLPSIAREDPRFLVVDKPAGWLVHPTRPDGTFTLIDWLRETYPGEFLSLVSRLDRETSGLLLVGRGKENASRLGKMQQRREIHKTYLAVVHGRPPASGVIDQPLDRLGKHQPSQIYIRQAVVAGTYPAITEFKTLGSRIHPEHGQISLLEATPKTGRLHQIRAHFEHQGFPVLNDKIYGKEDAIFLNFINKVKNEQSSGSRHCLHSHKIIFSLQAGSDPGTDPGSDPGSDLGTDPGTDLGSDPIVEVSVEIGMPRDMQEIWEAGIPADENRSA